MDKSFTGFVSNRKVILSGICLFSVLGFLVNFYSVESPSAYPNVKPYLAMIWVFFYFKTGMHPPPSWRDLVFMIVGASIEELIFRVLLITILLELFADRKFKGFWAILISSIIFSIPHYHRFYMIQGIFPGSLLLGFIFYKTRSVFLPALIHVLSNTTGDGGILGALIFSSIYLIISLPKKISVSYLT